MQQKKPYSVLLEVKRKCHTDSCHFDGFANKGIPHANVKQDVFINHKTKQQVQRKFPTIFLFQFSILAWPTSFHYHERRIEKTKEKPE